jgi:hypothetical protein
MFPEYTLVSVKLTGKGMQRWDENLLDRRLELGGMTFRQLRCTCGYFNKKKPVYTEEIKAHISKLEQYNAKKTENSKLIPSHITILFKKG